MDNKFPTLGNPEPPCADNRQRDDAERLRLHPGRVGIPDSTLDHCRNLGLPKVGENGGHDLAVTLFQRLNTQRAEEWASSLVERFGTFASALVASEEAQMDVLQDSVAVALMSVVRTAALEAFRAEIIDRPIISNSIALVNYLMVANAHVPFEQLRILFLDGRNHLLAEEVVALGTIDEVAVHPREIVRRALELRASALIMIHNHPSGDPSPSQGDRDVTLQVVNATKPIGISLHDHLIVGSGGWFSFRQEGLI